MRKRFSALRRWMLGGVAAALLVAGWTGGWAAAAPFRIGLPLRCDPGKTCWIVNYVDHDPTKGVRDYACGHATYNGADGKGHNGTDFAIRDGRAMRTGVAVLAAAAGVVRAVRDDMPDGNLEAAVPPSVPGGKDCGNGVVIDHGNGWTTQYCHLREGSVAVAPGQRVEAGQTIGLVGLSGFTEFPHLHLTVRHDGKVIDPFVGLARKARCGLGEAPLWSNAVLAELPYAPTAIYTAGFAGERPSPAKARNGDYDGSFLDRHAPALVLWADLFNVEKGDRIILGIRGPDGRLFVRHADVVPRNQARRFVYAGRPLRSGEWPLGIYTGTVRLERPNGAGPPAPRPLATRITVR